jgi:hypothetical protein
VCYYLKAEVLAGWKGINVQISSDDIGSWWQYSAPCDGFSLYLPGLSLCVGLSAASVDNALSGELKAVWLGFCLQLFFIAYLLLVNSRRSNLHLSTVVLGGLVVIVDSILVSVFFAKTFGAQLLGLSGMGVLVGSFLWRLSERDMPAPKSKNSLNPTAP